MYLAGPVGKPVDRQTYEGESEFAEQIAAIGGRVSLTTRVHWREGLKHNPDLIVLGNLLEFIESLVMIDPKKRPMDAEVLMHPYMQAIA